MLKIDTLKIFEKNIKVKVMRVSVFERRQGCFSDTFIIVEKYSVFT